MIILKQEGLVELRKKGLNAANTLEHFVANINIPLYKGENCTIWVEDKAIIEMYNSLSEYQIFHEDKLVTLGEMLCRLFDAYAKMSMIENIVVDTQIQASDNWIYYKCGVWIMTANYFFTTLYAAFQVRGFSTIELDKFGKKHGFSFKLQEVE